jgi:mono/diheme cytochrome c family protein
MMTVKLRDLAVAVAASALLAPLAASAGGNAAAGKTLFTTNCASCHGDSGKGDGPVGATLKPPLGPPRDFTKGEFKFDTDKDGKTGTDADLKNVITKGGAAFGGSPMMAPWPSFTDAQYADLIAYIRTFHKQ